MKIFAVLVQLIACGFFAFVLAFMVLTFYERSYIRDADPARDAVNQKRAMKRTSTLVASLAILVFLLFQLLMHLM